jgi:hypothetical protein
VVGQLKSKQIKLLMTRFLRSSPERVDNSEGMRRLTLGFVLLLVCSSSLSQQPRSLIDGLPIQLVGTIGLEPRGNNNYIVIKPSQPYTALFDDTDHRRVNEIGLTLDGQWDALKALVGQKVSVSGVIQLEPTSPYYLNGTLVVAKSIRLANGSVLTPEPYKPIELSASLTRFHTLVTFAPRAFERWTYRTWGDNGHLLPGSQDYLSCRLNGPGDVMNCYCPAGFAFTATGTVSDGHFTKTAVPQDGFDFAQFSLADPVRHSISEAVECTRNVHR